MTTLGSARIARRYALALLHTAERMDRVEAVRHDMEALITARRDSPAFHRVMDSPLVPSAEKRRMVERALTGADEITRRFMDLLIAKRRTDILPAIYEEYTRGADEAAGVARAFVTSAAPLSDAQLVRLEEAIRQRLNRPVLLHVRVEPAMLGGIAVRVGDTVWDGSVRGALEAMRETMLLESAMAEQGSGGG